MDTPPLVTTAALAARAGVSPWVLLRALKRHPHLRAAAVRLTGPFGPMLFGPLAADEIVAAVRAERAALAAAARRATA